MAESQELQVQQKREVEKKAETTTPGRVFVPVTDIFETPEALTGRRNERRRGHDRAAQSRAIQAAKNPGELAPSSCTETQG